MTALIEKGERIPNLRLRRLHQGAVEEVFTHDLFRGKKALLLGFPGAFTPVCDGKHLPDFIANAEQIRARGFEMILGMSVNDPWVMALWENQLDCGDIIPLYSDGNAELTRALGVDFDASALGAGIRCNRFVMALENAVVRQINVESGMAYACTRPGDLEDITAI